MTKPVVFVKVVANQDIKTIASVMKVRFVVLRLKYTIYLTPLKTKVDFQVISAGSKGVSAINE